MEKRIKQAVCLLILIAMLCCGAANAAAMSLNVTYDGTNDALVASGSIQTEKANVPLLLTLRKDGEVVDVMTTLAGTAENGEAAFQFDPIPFSLDAASGDYLVTASAQYIDETAELLFPYTGTDQVFAALSKINQALLSQDAENFDKTVGENAELLGVDAAAFLSLGEKGRTLFCRYFANRQYDLPETGNTADDREKIKSAAVAFRTDYDGGIAAATFREINSPARLAQWLDAYTEKYDLKNDDPSTEQDERKLYPYLVSVKESAVLSARIAALPELLTPAEIRDALFEAAILTIIEESNYTRTREVILEFPELFHVNTTGVSGAAQGQAFSAISGNAYLSYEAVSKAFAAAIADGKRAPSGSSSGTSSGKSSGSSRPIGGEVTVDWQPQVVAPSEQQLPFADLEQSEWAVPAIRYLYEKNIVRGKTETVFGPNDAVTRAEFAKLVVTALGFQNSGNAIPGCIDIPADAWYADVVSIAQQHGVVLGDENGCFRPEEPISRQDMAVMICRAWGLDITGEDLPFDDAGAISVYAKGAVAVLYERHIINGMGNGCFEPLQSATRAQAAQMIYQMARDAQEGQ